MSVPPLVIALAPVLEVLRRLGVRHVVAGSIASSAHGVPRASIDVDVVAELAPEHTSRFIAALRDRYYVPEQRVVDAVAQPGSFNLIHLDTMFKVDVFVARDRPFDRRVLDRADEAVVAGATDPIPVSSPEDTLLATLEWFRRGGEVSERPWGDGPGLVRVAASGVSGARRPRTRGDGPAAPCARGEQRARRLTEAPCNGHAPGSAEASAC